MVGESTNGRSAAGPPAMGGPVSDCLLTQERPAGRPDEVRAEPWAPGPRPAHPAEAVGEQRRRRRAAEASAAAAEAAAADAATRASEAIALAARAAEEAEAAADDAARAADEVAQAVAAEQQALALAEQLTRAARHGRDGDRNGARHAGGAPRQDGPPARRHAAEDTTTAATQTFDQVEDVDWTDRTETMAAAVPADTEPDESATTVLPATAVAEPAGGRAARRRAQEARAREATAAVAREATRDPVTEVFGVDEETTAVAAAPAPARDRKRGATRPGKAPAGKRGTPRRGVLSALRARRRPSGRVVLAAVSAVAVLAVAGILAAVLGGPSGPSPAAVIEATPPTAAAAPAAQAGGAEAAGADSGAQVDPTTPKAVAYLKALRAAEIPTSKTGVPETEAAAVICEQLAQGADQAALVKALPAVLPTVSKKQANDVVNIAVRKYC